MVASVKVEIEVGKESKDVVDLVADLIEDIKAKKDVSAIAAENLPGLMKAIEGFDQLDDEAKSKHRNSTIAYTGMRFADVLAPAGEEAVAE